MGGRFQRIQQNLSASISRPCFLQRRSCERLNNGRPGRDRPRVRQARRLSAAPRPKPAMSCRPIPICGAGKASAGEEDGRKSRSVCVAIASRGDAGLTHLALLESLGPLRARISPRANPALELCCICFSEAEAWIIVSEYSYDVLERSVCWSCGLHSCRNVAEILKAALKALRPPLMAARSRVDRL